LGSVERKSESAEARDELREWLIGESDKGVLVVVFTRRDAGGTLRLISARRASRKERRMYEEIKKLSV